MNVVARGCSILEVSILGLPREGLAQYEKQSWWPCRRKGSAKCGAVYFYRKWGETKTINIKNLCSLSCWKFPPQILTSFQFCLCQHSPS